MIQKFKKYFLKNKKAICQKAAMLALFLLLGVIFYGSFVLVKDIIFISIENEKATHAREVCEKMSEISKQSDYFLDKINQLENKKKHLNKGDKKEIILELRKIEGNIREIDSSYSNFSNNDFSIKFFSASNDTEADKLFSQIKNLPLYGYRAVYSMEDSLKLNYITDSQLDVLNIEFSELQEKIKSVSSVCN